LKNRSVVGLAGKPRSGGSQNSAGRGQVLTILQGNSRSIAQKSGETWTGQADLQPISFKSDRLLAVQLTGERVRFHADRGRDLHDFPPGVFLVEGTLPWPA